MCNIAGLLAFQLRFALCVVAGLGAAVSAANRPYLHAPAVNEYAKHDPSGLTILSTGRYLKPSGTHFPVAQFPYGLAMSRDGSVLFVASEDAGQFITDWQGARPTVVGVKPPVYMRNGRERTSNAGGADFSPDGGTLYWSSGETGAVYVYDVASREKIAEISLNTETGGRKYEDSYAVDVK